ncbi:uncharacterized protein LOC134836266 [Culicoides brevitarsis]|uniref:uncharacterized protein LOC134836266 n=1 Tax=Culicoides brevitarsis TaxID=469753 RepID=UPI00307B3486
MDAQQFFIVSTACIWHFLENFHEIHDWVMPRYEKKVLVVVDKGNIFSYDDILNVLQHRIVINDLPLTLLLKPNFVDDIDTDTDDDDGRETIDIWSAFPYSAYRDLRNRFFVENSSFLHENDTLIPKMTNLDGIQVTGAFIHYPPYSAWYRVPPGTGNAHVFGSNESYSVKLGGQEHIILVEFCLKYNCTLVARLEYDEELWGESFHNHTGFGLIGALTMRDANVSCAALYLWDNTYEFTQYTAIIQRATIDLVLPKPKPLPYWQTPILPFPAYIWGYVIGAFFIGAVTLFIVNLAQLRMKDDKVLDYGLFESIYAVFMMSIFQGVNINIKFLSNIVLFTILLMFALIIGNLYAGGLASVMTVTRYEEPLDSLEKVVESNLQWGAPAWDWIFTIKQSDYPPFKKFVQKFVVKPIPEMHKLVKAEKFAVTLETMQHGTLSYQPYFDVEDSKFLMMTKHAIYWQDTVIMTSKTWPFMEQLNRIVLMQQESGIQYYWEMQSAKETMNYDIQRNIEENAKPPEGGEPVRLSVQHILGALFLLLFGSIAATISFFFELFWFHKVEKSTLMRKAVSQWKNYKQA